MMMSSRAWEQLRPWPVYVMAAAVPVSIALTNVAKAVALLFALFAVAHAMAHRSLPQALRALRTPQVVLVMLVLAALSLLYTSAPLEDAARALGKHAKLLLIPIALLLLRSREHARNALLAYLVVQCFVIFSSWLLNAGVSLPWGREDRNSPGTVFSSYLDQSMLTALGAVLCWQLRSELPGRWGPTAGAVLAVVAVGNLFFVLPGRSGPFAFLPVLALIMWWALPRRARWAALLIPVAVAAAAYSASPQFQRRAAAVVTESQAFFNGQRDSTSSGERLTYWTVSIRSIAERPLAGHGVGTWGQEFRRLHTHELSPAQQDLRNPHQEFLLWGVELGVLGVALVIALLAAAARDASRLPQPARHAIQATVLLIASMCLINSVLFDAVTGEAMALLLGTLLAFGATASQRARVAGTVRSPASGSTAATGA